MKEKREQYLDDIKFQLDESKDWFSYESINFDKNNPNLIVIKGVKNLDKVFDEMYELLAETTDLSDINTKGKDVIVINTVEEESEPEVKVGSSITTNMPDGLFKMLFGDDAFKLLRR